MGETKFFMLYVEGQKSPTTKHSTIEEATSEAERLFLKDRKKVYVLESIFDLEPKTEYNKITF